MLKEIILAFIVSIDTYIAASACCNSGIRIPLSSAVIIDLFSAAVLWVTVTMSDMISGVVSPHTCHIIGTVVLIIIGTLNIAKSFLRNIIGYISEKGGISLKMGSYSMFIKLCLDDTAADMDCSKVISPSEAVILAVAGSFDSAATGLGCGGSDISAAAASSAAFLCGAAALMLGSLTGRKISSLRRDLSWSGGLLLILFAVFTF